MSDNFYEVLKLVKQGCDMMERGVHNMEVAHALSEYGRFLILKGNVKDGLYSTKKAKECLEKIVEKQTGGGTIWALEKYARENEKRYDILDRYYELLLLEAPYLFDSFMLYVEKERPLKERYYLPKKKQFAKFQLVESMQALEDDELDLLTISLCPGSG